MTGHVDISQLDVLEYSFYIFELLETTYLTKQMGLLRTKKEKEEKNEFIEKEKIKYIF